MNDNTYQRSQTRLEMRWLPVLDAAGRTRMESTWVDVPLHNEVPVAQAA